MGHEITSHDDSEKEAIEEEDCAEKAAIEKEWRDWLRAFEKQSNSNGDLSFYEKLKDLLYQSVEGKYWKILLEAYEKVPLARKTTLSSSGNQTAFHLLVGRSTAIKVVEEVLRHVDGDDVKIKDEEGNTVLHTAAAKGILNKDICKLIHFQFPNLIEECNNEGKTALSLFTTGLVKDPYNGSWNTAVDGYEAMINILNLTTLPLHSTPLHMAITYSFFHGEDGMETFKKVKEKEFILKMRNEKGNTALHLAAECALDDLCKSMADACPELVNIDNCEGETPLFIAARSVTINNFRNLYEYANQNTIDKPSGDGNTILHCALQSENLDIAYYILQKHSSFRSRTNLDDLTPLKILAKIPYAFRSRTPLTMVEKIIYSCIWVVDLEEPRKNEVDYCWQGLKKCFNIVKRLMTSDLEKLDQDHNIEENLKDTSTKHAHSEDIPADSEDRVESVIASLEHLSRRGKRIQEPRPLRKRVSNYCVKCMALITHFIKTCIVLIKSFIKTCLAPFTIAISFLIKHLPPGAQPNLSSFPL